jgi:hypothetical protein
MRRHILLLCLAAICAAAFVGCTAYKSREVPFRPPQAYENMQALSGAALAAEGYDEAAKAKEAFGFNIIKAGLLPVQVIIDNQGSKTLHIVPDQTFLIDEKGSYWNLLENRTAYERVQKSSEYARLAKETGKGSLLGGAGGAIVGAAIGILTGENVAEAAGKGAAVGAAGGAIIGGTKGSLDREPERRIASELAGKNLENKPIQPGMLGRGFLFFPAEAKSADKLRLQVKLEGTQRPQNLVFDFAAK